MDLLGPKWESCNGQGYVEGLNTGQASNLSMEELDIFKINEDDNSLFQIFLC